MAGIGPATSPLPRECSTTEPHGQTLCFAATTLERETGIEPVSLAWKAKVLPFNYSRAYARGAAQYCSNAAIHTLRVQKILVERAGFEPFHLKTTPKHGIPTIQARPAYQYSSLVERAGFEPAYSLEGRFTVCCH